MAKNTLELIKKYAYSLVALRGMEAALRISRLRSLLGE